MSSERLHGPDRTYDPGFSIQRPPFPPFTEEDAWKKVLAAEAAWNTRDPDRVVLAYTEDTLANRDEFLSGRDEVHAFLVRKWEKELDYVLRKDLWTFAGNRIAVRFQYEWHDAGGQWWRSLRQRELGVRRKRADAAPRGQHQRRGDRGGGPSHRGPRADGDGDGIPLR